MLGAVWSSHVLPILQACCKYAAKLVQDAGAGASRDTMEFDVQVMSLGDIAIIG